MVCMAPRTGQTQNLCPEPIMFERFQPDLDTYVRRVRTGPCFVCAILARDRTFPHHHIVYEDEDALAHR
jgi:hypothetical protein